MSGQAGKFQLLLAWMGERGISGREIGRRLGIDNMTAHRLLNGKLKMIDPAIAVAIERETGGAVTASDFITFMSSKEAA